ncbi:MAG: MMPL family transporter, partial [Bdellovibrionota bacterium]
MRTFSHFILRRAGLVAIIGTTLAIAGAYFSVELYKNLRTDLAELLPTSARSVQDLDDVTRRLESIDSLAVLVFSKNTEASKRFVHDLVGKLESVPKNIIASVEYRIEKELKFFREHSPLYMDLGDLSRVRNYIIDRIEYEKSLYNPLNIFSEQEIPEPRLDFLALRQKYELKTSGYSKLPGGYYATPDETIRAVLAYLPGKTSSMDQVHILKSAVEGAIHSLNLQSYAADIQIRYTGGVQDTLEEHSALIADLEISTAIVIVLVAIAMFVFFRNLRATFALVASLLGGALWTFGVSYFVVGYLNANTAFLGSIIIGNGINFGIIILARYIEERRKGFNNLRGIRTAMVYTATATWTAALAAGLSYGSLVLTGFRGFRQFGIIGLIGMLLCWLSAFTLLPAYLTLIDKFSSLVPRGRRIPHSTFTTIIAKIISKRPAIIWGFSFLLTVASLSTLVSYHPGIIETNLGKLRSKHSLEHGSVYYSRYLDQIFQRYLSPLVILTKSRDEAAEIANRLRKLKEQQGKASMIASVQTLDDFIPQDQLEKIKILKNIRRLLPHRLIVRLSESDQALVARFLSETAMKPIYQNDLPPLILSKFTEKDGSIGKLVLIEPPLDHSTWEGDKMISLIRELRDVADSVSPGAPVAGTLPITSDMISAISRDGPRATFFAFAAVLILVVFLFREIKTITLVLFSLILGATWLGGIILGFGIKINFLNFIALPITFGIGVDYGVNIFQRYR